MSWRILGYHWLPPESSAGFVRQLDALAGRGWQAVSLSEGLARRGEPASLFTVSFDDGHYSVCEVAQRLLDERGIKAIFYVATDYVEQGRTYQDARPGRTCTWAQLGRWLGAGHEIGSHTHSHAVLPSCPSQWPTEELERSREIMLRELGYRPQHFAYPYGGYDRGTYERLKALGTWSSAATADRGWNRVGTDPLLLRRDLMEPAWSMSHCRLRLSLGEYPPLSSLARRARLLLFRAGASLRLDCLRRRA
jgi:peptidoglycan/xylan/chitin deacetylase (PgdA/CDA1 family)